MAGPEPFSPSFHASLAAAPAPVAGGALETVLAVADALYERLDLEGLGQRALTALSGFIDIPGATIYALDEAGQALEMIASVGLAPEVFQYSRTLSASESLTGLAVAGQTVVESQDLATDPRIAPQVRSHLLANGYRGTISVPLQHGGRTVGAMNFMLREARSLTSAQLEVLLACGRIIALALLNARQFDRLQRAEQSLRQANEELEARVLARTAELSEANRRLQAEVAARAEAEEALRHSEERYRQLAITDALTGLYNSRHFHASLETEVERARRYGDPVGLLLLDVDNFKRFNDSYGHVEGDKVLAALGRIMRESLRKIDSAFRYGGEEFTVILPRCDEEDLRKLAERIRSLFAAEIFEVGGERLHMTVSIGGTIYRRSAPVESFIRCADKAMYRAKSAGKNRVELVQFAPPGQEGR